MTLPSKLMSPVMAGRAMAGPARPQMAVAAQKSFHDISLAEVFGIERRPLKHGRKRSIGFFASSSNFNLLRNHSGHSFTSRLKFVDGGLRRMPDNDDNVTTGGFVAFGNFPLIFRYPVWPFCRALHDDGSSKAIERREVFDSHRDERRTFLKAPHISHGLRISLPTQIA